MNEDIKAESLLSLMIAIVLFAVVLSLIVGTDSQADGFLNEMASGSYGLLDTSW